MAFLRGLRGFNRNGFSSRFQNLVESDLFLEEPTPKYAPFKPIVINEKKEKEEKEQKAKPAEEFVWPDELDEILCPISLETMDTNAVVVPETGHSFSQAGLDGHFVKSKTCPKDRRDVAGAHVPNYALRNFAAQVKTKLINDQKEIAQLKKQLKKTNKYKKEIAELKKQHEAELSQLKVRVITAQEERDFLKQQLYQVESELNIKRDQTHALTHALLEEQRRIEELQENYTCAEMHIQRLQKQVDELPRVKEQLQLETQRRQKVEEELKTMEKELKAAVARAQSYLSISESLVRQSKEQRSEISPTARQEAVSQSEAKQKSAFQRARATKASVVPYSLLHQNEAPDAEPLIPSRHKMRFVNGGR